MGTIYNIFRFKESIRCGLNWHIVADRKIIVAGDLFWVKLASDQFTSSPQSLLATPLDKKSANKKKKKASAAPPQAVPVAKD